LNWEDEAPPASHTYDKLSEIVIRKEHGIISINWGKALNCSEPGMKGWRLNSDEYGYQPEVLTPTREFAREGFSPEYRDNTEYVDLLRGVEDFSHILVLYRVHKLDAEGRGLNRVHPTGRKDLPLVGVFATWSPASPKPILATPFRLLEREGPSLCVACLDAGVKTNWIAYPALLRRYAQTNQIPLEPAEGNRTL